MDNKAFLQIKNLEKAWPTLLVHIDLDLEQGKSLAILGPSGCGKSTMLRLISGLEKADKGNIIINGQDVTFCEPCKRSIGMVFQDFALFPHLNVEQNIEYGLISNKVKKPERLEIVNSLLQSVGLYNFNKRNPADCSGGEKQRIALARSLATKPHLMLFDEPLSALDVALRQKLRTELIEQQKKTGFTAIHVTHNIEEAMIVGDKIAIMWEGKIIQIASPLNLWNKPASKTVALFLGSGALIEILRISKINNMATLETKFGKLQIDSRLEKTYEDIIKTQKKVWLFFERNSAKICSKEEKSNNELIITAKCRSVTFTGDSLDCVFCSENASFSIKLPNTYSIVASDNVTLKIQFCDVSLIPE